MPRSKSKPKAKARPAISDLLDVMAKLRSPEGCPWDLEQTHMSLRFHAVEEVYELIDAVEAQDDLLLEEELGDVLLQVVFHCQLAAERGAFKFEEVARHITEKLIRRHPHVFANADAKTVDAVWAQWDKIKAAEKAGTHHERPSALDGIPNHLPALLRTEKLAKKAAKIGIRAGPNGAEPLPGSKAEMSRRLFEMAAWAQEKGWSAEGLLRSENKRRERQFRAQERRRLKVGKEIRNPKH